MIIYVDDDEKVKIYPTRAKIAKAIEALLELDQNSVCEEATIQALKGHIQALNETIENQDKVIKTLKQDSIFGKIRTEIEQKIVRRSGLSHTRSERDRNDAFLEVLDIIDKYIQK